MANLTTAQLAKMRGKPVKSADGRKFGAIEDVYFDPVTREPQWLGVGARTSLLGKRHFVVPVVSATLADDAISLDYTKEKIEAEPPIDPDSGMTFEALTVLSAYFGLEGHFARQPRRLREGDVYSGQRF